MFKKHALFLCALLLACNCIAQNTILQRLYNDTASIRSIATLDSSNYMLAGYKDVQNQARGFLMMVDSVGKPKWTKYLFDTLNLGSSGNVINGTFRLKAISNNRFLLTGGTSYGFGVGQGHAFILIVDTSGTILKSKKFTAPGITVPIYDAIENSDGTFAVCGSYITQNWFFFPIADALLAKLDSNLSVIWAKTYSKQEGDKALHIAASPDNTYILQVSTQDTIYTNCQTLLYKVDTAGSLIWAKESGDTSLVVPFGQWYTSNIPTNCVLLVKNNGDIISTFSANWYTGHPETIMQRLDNNGNEMVAHQFGKHTFSGQTLMASEIVLENGDMVIPEFLSLLRVDSNFNIVWRRSVQSNVSYISGLGLLAPSKSSWLISCGGSLTNYKIKFTALDSTGNIGCFNNILTYLYDTVRTVGTTNIISLVTTTSVSLYDSVIQINEWSVSTTDSLGCFTATAISDTDNEKENLSLVSNPFLNYLEIKNATPHLFYDVFDLQGKKIKSGYLAKEKTIDVNDFTKGVYLIQFSNSYTLQTFKFIRL